MGGDAVTAQTLEPEFEGEVVGVFPDGTSKKLEKHNVRMRTGAGVYIAGFAASKSKTKVLVEGGSASVRFDASQPIALIVRAKDNKADPMSIVRVFRMKSSKKNRSAVISAVGSFSVSSNTMDYLRFTAEKYGESSYRLTFDERPRRIRRHRLEPQQRGREDGDRFGVRHRRRSERVIPETRRRFRSARCRASLHRF